MKNFKCLLFVAFVFVTFQPVFSYADIYINEIYYSPKTNSWIEIYNDTDLAVDLTQYKILDAGAVVNGHGITSVSGTNPLPAHTYGVIATTGAITKFNSVSWSLFKSALAASTTPGDTIRLKLSSGTADTDVVTFSNTQGANGDGNSLQRQPDGTWIAATPTPGAINSDIPVVVQNDNQDATPIDNTTTTTTDESANSDNSGSTAVWYANSSPASLPSSVAPVDFQISAGRDRLTSVGNSILFVVKSTKTQGILPSSISYSWSFGDGSVGQGNTLSHTYKFPGEYSVVVNAGASDQMAVDRLTVKVYDPQIILQKVDGGVSVSNNSSVEINLEGWTLNTSGKFFTFPKDTLLPVGRKVVFADDVTMINSGDLQIKNPLGKTYASISSGPAADVKVPLAVVPVSTLPKSLDDISVSVSDVSQKLAMLQSEINPPNPAPKIATESTNVVPEQTLVSLDITTETATSAGTDLNLTTSAPKNQTAVVFLASSSPSIISHIFAWPIAGFNFIRGLFVEK
jgi:hypothetical protein